MKLHANARTCPNSRRLLVDRIIELGWSVTAAAEAAGVSERTAYRWLARWRAEGSAGLLDRSSAPKRIPHRTRADRVEAIERLRRLWMTAAEIAEVLAMALSTVSAVLRRIGLGKRSRLEPPEPPNRYERKRPGELVHLDVKKLGRIAGAGHAVTGLRTSQNANRRRRRRGAPKAWEFVHVCVDDATRLAYAEVLDDERGESAAAFLRRAVAWFRGSGVEVERVISGQRRLLPLTRPRARPSRARHPPPPLHPPLSPAHQRQGRALHPNARQPLGTRRDLRILGRADRRAARLAQPLQLHPTTRQPRQKASRLTPDEPG